MSERIYDELAEAHGGDEHWAFGTGFTDAGVPIEAPVPDGVDPGELAEYCLMLGDDALIYAQRLSEWVASAPELEEEVALANTALDLLGQARLLLSRAGHLLGRTEDELAYWRSDAEFRHVNLAELSDGDDFGVAVARLLIFASWRLAVLHRLRDSRDPVLAAVAAKGVKELAYHRDYAARWTLRLGDGTCESRERMRAALDFAWPYLAELFRASETERRLAAQGVAVDPADADLEAEVRDVLAQVITRATLAVPDRTPIGTIGGRGGRQGVHTEHLGHVLAEMQSLARQHPQATW